jgi:hypothetical protein
MDISFLIRVVEQKVSWLNQLKINYTVVGDIEKITEVESQITETQDTLDKLRQL